MKEKKGEREPEFFIVCSSNGWRLKMPKTNQCLNIIRYLLFTVIVVEFVRIVNSPSYSRRWYYLVWFHGQCDYELRIAWIQNPKRSIFMEIVFFNWQRKSQMQIMASFQQYCCSGIIGISVLGQWMAKEFEIWMQLL